MTYRTNDGRSVALVHDYLTQRGGAERVVLQLASMFPGAPVHTALYEPELTFPDFADTDVRTSPLQGRVSPDNFRRAVLSYPKAFRDFELDDFDIVIASSSAFAHHVQHPNLHVYCHTPPRFLYSTESYFDSRLLRAALRPALTTLRISDRAAARGARTYAANSETTRHRIARGYGFDAPVIHPPLRTGHLPTEAGPAPSTPRALVVARLLPYKRVDLAISACVLAGVPLTVVGDGPDLERLRSMATGDVEFLGRLNDEEMADQFREHSIVLVPGKEDFGYIPVEAAWAGRPVIAFGAGGARETVRDGLTGALLPVQDPRAWAAELRRALDRRWEPETLRDWAQNFGPVAFERSVRRWIGDDVADGRGVDEGRFPTSLDRIEIIDDATIRSTVHEPVPDHHASRQLRPDQRRQLLAGVDSLAIAGALIAASAIEPIAARDETLTPTAQAVMTTLWLPVMLTAMAHFRLLHARRVASRVQEWKRIAQATATTATIVAGVGLMTRNFASRSWLLGVAAVVGLSLIVTREGVRTYFRRRRRSGVGSRPVVVVGVNDRTAGLLRDLENDPSLGYRVVAVVDDALELGAAVGDHVVVGRCCDTVGIARRSGAVGAIVGSDVRGSAQVIRDLADAGLHAEITLGLEETDPQRLLVRTLGSESVAYVESATPRGWTESAKRTFDLVAATTMLVVSSPALLLAGIAIKLTSRGPVLFRQRRVGRNGNSFEVLKLRTMVRDAEERLPEVLPFNEASGAMFKMREDPRVTRVGRCLRRLSIDELPQLVNVLKGEMSLVGPRPALPHEMAQWDPATRRRLLVRPGISGAWQVGGRSDLAWDETVRKDLNYVNNWSLTTDLAILARTVPAVLNRRGAL